MKKQIEKTVNSLGLDLSGFLIGEGARDKNSEIHYKPYRYSPRRDPRKEYSIQFCDDIVAIWDIGKRIDLHSSIDMNWDGSSWSDITELRVREIGIQGTSERTEAAVMPIEAFEPYLRYKFGKKESPEEEHYTNVEGEKVQIYSTKYERDPKLREQAIKIHGTKCQACGFSFGDKYGDIGNGFIEVHHIKPVSERIRTVNPETDLVCLCSNCHRMVHRKQKKVMTMDEIRAAIKP